MVLVVLVHPDRGNAKPMMWDAKPAIDEIIELEDGHYRVSRIVHKADEETKAQMVYVHLRSPGQF